MGVNNSRYCCCPPADDADVFTERRLDVPISYFLSRADIMNTNYDAREALRRVNIMCCTNDALGMWRDHADALNAGLKILTPQIAWILTWEGNTDDELRKFAQENPMPAYSYFKEPIVARECGAVSVEGKIVLVRTINCDAGEYFSVKHTIYAIAGYDTVITTITVDSCEISPALWIRYILKLAESGTIAFHLRASRELAYKFVRDEYEFNRHYYDTRINIGGDIWRHFRDILAEDATPEINEFVSQNPNYLYNAYVSVKKNNMHEK